jgi:anti-sigma regulatory factor (Ser/Thr protein kinase)
MAQPGQHVARTGLRPGPAWPVSSVMPPLAALPTAPSAARAYVRATLAKWRMSGLADAELLLSELVTNSVHAARVTCMPVKVRLSANSARILIEVWDGNLQPPVPHGLEKEVPALNAEGGRGLFLVETLSERWGWYPTRNPEGKVTWCEIRTACPPGTALFPLTPRRPLGVRSESADVARSRWCRPDRGR